MYVDLNTGRKIVKKYLYNKPISKKIYFPKKTFTLKNSLDGFKNKFARSQRCLYTALRIDRTTLRAAWITLRAASLSFLTWHHSMGS